MYGIFTYMTGWFLGKMLVNIPAPWSIWVMVCDGKTFDILHSKSLRIASVVGLSMTVKGVNSPFGRKAIGLAATTLCIPLFNIRLVSYSTPVLLVQIAILPLARKSPISCSTLRGVAIGSAASRATSWQSSVVQPISNLLGIRWYSKWTNTPLSNMGMIKPTNMGW